MSQALSDLPTIVRSLRPVRQPGSYAFCSLPDAVPAPDAAVGWFREAEGITVILPVEAALDAGLVVEFEAAWIALSVHTALSAVGVTAAVSAALAEAGISCNIVAACRHDHLFVATDRAEDALDILSRLSMTPPAPA